MCTYIIVLQNLITVELMLSFIIATLGALKTEQKLGEKI